MPVVGEALAAIEAHPPSIPLKAISIRRISVQIRHLVLKRLSLFNMYDAPYWQTYDFSILIVQERSPKWFHFQNWRQEDALLIFALCWSLLLLTTAALWSLVLRT